MKVRTKLGELQRALEPVLEELRSSDLGRRPFVIVDEPTTKRFVQFARVVKRDPGDDEKGIARLGEMGFDVPALGIYLIGFGNSPDVGARMATETMRMWLPDDAELLVTLDGSGAN